jgi:hypothetical protein
MKRVFSAVSTKHRPSTDRKLSNIDEDFNKDNDRLYTGTSLNKKKVYLPIINQQPRKSSLPRNSVLGLIAQDKKEDEMGLAAFSTHEKKKEYIKKLSLVKINFDFEEYGRYPDRTFKPSAFFYKFLAAKENDDFERKKENDKKSSKRLRLNIPNTLVCNDGDANFWMYTDEEGFVCKKDSFSDNDVISRFRSSYNDPNEILAVSKTPVFVDDRLTGNYTELLNMEELESCLTSKNASRHL